MVSHSGSGEVNSLIMPWHALYCISTRDARQVKRMPHWT